MYSRRLEPSILATTAAPGDNAVPTGPASSFGLPTNITRYMGNIQTNALPRRQSPQ